MSDHLRDMLADAIADYAVVVASSAQCAANAILADLRFAVVELPDPFAELPDVFARWVFPDQTTVGWDDTGNEKSVWLTPFARCTPTHARVVAAALLAAADRAETPTEPSGS